jgi:hypothetical protein
MMHRLRKFKSSSSGKRHNNLTRKASGLLPLHILFCPNNNMINSLYFIVVLHKHDRIPIKDLPSLFNQALNTGFNLLLGRNA